MFADQQQQQQQEPEQQTDVSFIFKSGNDLFTQIPAHRSVLAATSNIFKELFYGELKVDDSYFEVIGASDVVFREFLKFFYGGQVELSMVNITGLLDLGHKYNVKKCINDCIRFLIESFDIENICTILQQALIYEQAEFLKKCEIFIAVNAEAVLKSSDFLECDKDVLAHILDLNMLPCSEADIFEACMSWVQAKCEQTTLTREIVEKHLGDLFYGIRFVSMTTKELCTLTTKYCSVLSSEYMTIATMSVVPESPFGKFNTSPRQVKWNERAVINCDRILNNEFQNSFDFDAVEETSFLTDKPLILGRFRCCEISRDIHVEVKITEIHLSGGANAKIRLEMKSNLRLHSKGSVIQLNRPILIRPGYFYTISIKKNSSNFDVFYSKELKDKMPLCGLSTIVSFHNYSTCKETGKVIGLISEMGFNRV